MIFSELYSAYYNTVAGVLRTAVQRPIDKKELRAIVEENASGVGGQALEKKSPNQKVSSSETTKRTTPKIE